MAVQNSLSQAQGRRVGLTAYLTKDAVKDQINKVVGGKEGQKFITAIVSAVNANPELQECDNGSILSAALLGQSLKLSPSPQLGQYHLVPFKDKKKGKVAQFIIGYKGYIQLAIRSGQYKKINVLTIKQGELVRFDPLNEDIEVNLIQDETVRENTPTMGYYAMFEYVNGFKKALYWSKEKMINHADRYSPAFSRDAKGGKYPKVSFADYEAGKYPKSDEWLYSSPWYQRFDDMGCKTMLRQLLGKWGVLSIEMQTALEADNAVINEDLTPDYVQTEEEIFVPDAEKEPDQIEAKTEEKEAPTENVEQDAAAALFG